MAKKLRVETKDEEMEYVKFGKTGLGVSPLCIGCMSYGIRNLGLHPWTLDEEKSRPLIRKALELNFLRKAIFAEIDNSLKRLGTDFVDLYQIHRWGPTMPTRALP